METQTAMLLNQEEWDDLEDMVSHYRLCTQWVEYKDRNRKDNPDYIARLERRRALATRVIEANK